MSARKVGEIARTRILVLGGGSGGLELAAQLARHRDLAVTLVDRDASHVWKPRLHEVATGTTSTSLSEISFYLLGQMRGFRFEQGTVERIDPETRRVLLAAIADEESGRELAEARTLDYDVCVVALGGATPDFGTPGVARHAIRLDEKQDADRFRDRFIAAMTQARGAGVPAEIAIVGTGPTGIGLAAHLRDAERGFLDPNRQGPVSKLLNITLLEAAPELMPDAGEDMRAEVVDRLRSLDVKLVTDAEVAEVHPREIATKKGERWPADIAVWAAGVVGHPALRELGPLPFDEKGRIEVDTQLRCKGHDTLFAIGDAASFTRPGADKPLPPTAQAAGQQASYLARALPRLVKGERVKPFEFRYRGRLLSLGRAGAVGKFGAGKRNPVLAGQFAEAAYHALERQHQWQVLGPVRGTVAILADLLSPAKGPGVRLHDGD